METVRQTRAGLPEGMPLIGFAGAPFTLAAYAVEGGGSRDYRAHQDADVRRRRRLGRADGPAGPDRGPTTSTPRSPPASRPCSCSTVGSAAWALTTTAAMCCRTAAR